METETETPIVIDEGGNVVTGEKTSEGAQAP